MPKTQGPYNSQDLVGRVQDVQQGEAYEETENGVLPLLRELVRGT